MKTMNKIFNYGIILIFSISLIACSGSDGKDGIDGTDGVDGAVGPQGPAGQNGMDGNANAIASGWLDADWNLTDNTTFKEMHVPITDISNNDLRDKTLVVVYLKQYGTSSIYTMPSAGRWSNAWYSFSFGKNTTGRDGLVITLESTDGAVLTDLQFSAVKGNQFRYLLIPANTASTGKSAIDYSNYKDVKKYYDLSD